MTAVLALRMVLAQGGKVEWDPSGKPHLRIPPSAHLLIRPHRDSIREILRRAAVLREQALRFIPKGLPMPPLALPEHQGGDGCLSCGAGVSEGHSRCAVCAMAITVALQDLRYPWSWRGGGAEQPLENPAHRSVRIQDTEWAEDGAQDGAQDRAQDRAEDG